MARDALFEPIKVGAVTAKNRIAFAPTGMGTAPVDGSVTDQALCHYVAHAKGGAGWITVEHVLCTNKYGTGILSFYSDRHLLGMRDLSDVIHAFGAVGIVQLGLGAGRQGDPVRLGAGLVAPTGEPYRVAPGTTPRGLRWMEGQVGATPRELTTAEVEELEDLYADSAERIMRAGFDGVEIHGAHGYLIAQFVSPLSNKRDDAYGGSCEKRLTLPRRIIRKVRKRVGGRFVVGYRISGDEHVPGGLTLEDTKEIVPALVAEGLDFVHLSSGRMEALRYLYPDEEAVILPEVRPVKDVVSVPVICPNIHSPALAEQVIQDGTADMVSMCRAHLADPEWPNKVHEGREDEIQRCILCNSCIKSLWSLFGTRCAVNPRVGAERFVTEYAPPVGSLKGGVNYSPGKSCRA